MGKLIKGENDLLTWCNNNGEFGQQLISEWTGECEDGYHYSIDEVTRGTRHKYKWICNLGHAWYAQVKQRTSSHSRCPICQADRGRENDGNESLYEWCIRYSDIGDTIMSEYTGVGDDGNNYNINAITRSARKKLLWKCSVGHEWYAWVFNRTRLKQGCPFCSGAKVTAENSLYTWCKNNGLYGDQIIKEWTGESDDGRHYDISNVSSASGKRMLWKCQKGHMWYTIVYHRIAGKTLCPYCNTKSTSYPEQFLYRALLQIYPKTISRGKINGYEYDIIIPEERACIEYGSLYWHSDKIERDLEKRRLCQEHGIKFILIYDGDEDEETYDDNLIIFHAHYENRNMFNNQLERILKHILKILGKSIDDINIEKAQTEAFNFMHNIDNTEDTQYTNETGTN